MAKYLSHAYGNVMNAISEAWNAIKSMSNVLNWYDRNIDNVFPLPKNGEEPKEYLTRLFPTDKKIRTVDWSDQKQRVKAYASIRMVRWLCRFVMIGVWNPKGEAKGLLSLRDLHRLEKHENNSRKGGITPFRIGQIAYSIGTKYAKSEGDAFQLPNVATHKDLEREDVQEVLKKIRAIASEMHKKSNDKFVQAQKDDSNESEEKGDVTIDQILDGSVNVKDIEDTELLDKAYADAETALKRKITMRKKALVN